MRVAFDEARLVSDAGLPLSATLSDRLGIEELVNESVSLGYRTPGAALPGRKVLSLMHGMLAGADSIDDMNLLRAGSTGLVLGHRVMAPSTPGTFVRAFTFGHVRQLDHVLDVALERAWETGAGPRKRGRQQTAREKVTVPAIALPAARENRAMTHEQPSLGTGRTPSFPLTGEAPGDRPVARRV
ncbi:MAG: hypothetical protein ACLP01_26010 [Solirubrobacteraceae bacterium]